MAIPLPNPNIDDTKKVDNLTWSSNKIDQAINSSAESILKNTAIKTKTYTGNGSTTTKITFDDTPVFILGIEYESDTPYQFRCQSFAYKDCYVPVIYKEIDAAGNPALYMISASVSDNTLTLTGTYAGDNMNRNGVDYKVYYI